MKNTLIKGCQFALLLAVFVTACGENHYQKGQILLREGRLNQAEQAFKAAIQKKPQDAAGYIGLGRVYIQKEDYEQALDYLNQALEHDAQSIGALQEMAQVYLLRGQLDLAVETCERALAITPHWRVYNVLGQALVQKQDDTKAEEAFKKAIELNREHEEGYINLADVYLRRGDIKVAEEEYQKFLAVKPENKDIHLRLAQLYLIQAQNALGKLQLDELAKAEALLVKVQELDPTDWTAPTSLGQIYAYQEKPDEAIAAFEAALKNANRPQQELSIYLPLIPLYNQQGQFSKAIQACDKLDLYLRQVQETPQLRNSLQAWREELHLNRGKAYLGQGDYLNAVGSLQDLVNMTPETSPNAPLHFYRLGLAQTGAKNYAEAITAYRRALQLNPTFTVANLKIAGVYITQGDTKKALTEIERVLPRKLTDEERLDVHYLAGLAHMSSEDYQKALSELQKALQIQPASAKAHVALGNLYTRQDKLDTARDSYQKALSYEPNSTGAYRGLAEVYALKNETTQAVDAYKKIIELEPEAANGYNDLAHYYAKLGTNLDEALQLANKALQLERSAQLRGTLGWVYYKKGMLQEARAELMAASLEAPEDARINYHFAVVAYQANDVDSAYYKLKAAVDAGGFPELNDARQLLQKIEAQRQ